jgi:hypothetical protein
MISENGLLRIYLRTTERMFTGDINITFYLRWVLSSRGQQVEGLLKAREDNASVQV